MTLMKVGYLCSDIDIPIFGHEGCSIHIREFTNGLIEAGHDAFIVCSWAGESNNVTTRARIYPVGPSGLDAVAWQLIEQEALIQDHNLERDLRSLLYNLWLKNEGGSIIERERPELLYERYSLFGYAGIELSRRYSIPLILEVNAPLCLEQAGYEKFPLAGTAEGIEAEILRGADAVIAVSQWLKEWILSRGVDEQRVHVIPNAAPGRLFDREVSGDRVKERYDLNGKQVVGFVGSFQPWHDVGGLLDAFHQLYQQDNSVRLLLVGAGPQRVSLEQSAHRMGLASAVVFTGSVPYELVPEFIAAMDVAVAPFRWTQELLYGSPIKLFEYMAAGKPTVAAALGQITEVVKHGETGWLYLPGDYEELAEGISMLLCSPDLASTIGKAGKQKILQEHTWKAVAERAVRLGETLRQPRASRGTR
ncbi:MAG: glycosyltransferase family 4 protein [Acidobacteria bacterium]|nr:glycosyltransferase family 4 protein [Acidobacteriota bacterium]